MLLPQRLDAVVGLLPLRNASCASSGRRPRSGPGDRWSRGTARISRTARGSGSATGSGGGGDGKRNRPRLLFWLSSLFQPPCFCSRWKVRTVPPGIAIGLSRHEDGLAGRLRRPGPASMPQAVVGLAVDGEGHRPGDALLAGPVVEHRFQRPRLGLPKSAVAATSLTRFLSFRASSAGPPRPRTRSGRTVPLSDRPGPAQRQVGVGEHLRGGSR